MAPISESQAELESKMLPKFRDVPRVCPREECKSTDVKLRYYNNNKRDQPRFVCNACNKMFTLGGKVRTGNKILEAEARARDIIPEPRIRIRPPRPPAQAEESGERRPPRPPAQPMEAGESREAPRWTTKRQRTGGSRGAREAPVQVNAFGEDENEDEDYIMSDEDEDEDEDYMQDDEDEGDARDEDYAGNEDEAQMQRERIRKGKAPEEVEVTRNTRRNEGGKEMATLMRMKDTNEIESDEETRRESIQKRALKYLTDAQMILEQAMLEKEAVALELECRELEKRRELEGREPFDVEIFLHSLKSQVVAIVHSWADDSFRLFPVAKYRLLLSREAQLKDTADSVQKWYHKILGINNRCTPTEDFMLNLEILARRLRDRAADLVDSTK